MYKFGLWFSNNITLGTIIIFILMMMIVVPMMISRHRKLARLKRYTEVCIGMSKSKMIAIMGDNYNMSSLRDGSYKYQWRMLDYSEGNHQRVSKVDIYVKDNKVIEIRPYNL